jgi:PQQ-dependent catabolism-associated CXXCW motif protein
VIRRALATGAVLAACLSAAPAQEPDGYRQSEYRAPTPETLAGATVIDNAEAYELWRTGAAAFIDVMPRRPKPDNLPEGTIWREKTRNSIPGATWLPNTGYGTLHATEDAYFQAGLAAATEGDLSRPILVFCLIDCWMSWNAAKRALTYGYETVFWYPDGTDGWELNDWPVEKATPFDTGS